MTKKSPSRRRPVIATAIVAASLTLGAGIASAQLKSYDSSKPSFWQNPPDDWFLGDETEAQKGLAPPFGPPTAASAAELDADPQEHQAAARLQDRGLCAAACRRRGRWRWGDKGTLFVGSFGAATSMRSPTRAARGGQDHPQGPATCRPASPSGTARSMSSPSTSCYKYDNAEANLDKMPEPARSSMTTCRPMSRMAGNTSRSTRRAGSTCPFGPPFNIGMPPTSVSQIRRVNPETAQAEIVALGVRNSVGGDVDPRTGDTGSPRTRATGSATTCRATSSTMSRKLGEHFGYPYCHQGDMPDPKFAMGHKCSEFTPPVLKLGAHVAPLGMKFYTGNQFPAEYKNNIFIAEHGSWNRHKYQGGRIDARHRSTPTARTPKQEVFAARLARPASRIIRPAGRHPAWPRTARCWSPMTGPAPSTGSATRSDVTPAASVRVGVGGHLPLSMDYCMRPFSGRARGRRVSLPPRPSPPRISKPAASGPRPAWSATARKASPPIHRSRPRGPAGATTCNGSWSSSATARRGNAIMGPLAADLSDEETAQPRRLFRLAATAPTRRRRRPTRRCTRKASRPRRGTAAHRATRTITAAARRRRPSHTRRAAYTAKALRDYWPAMPAPASASPR